MKVYRKQKHKRKFDTLDYILQEYEKEVLQIAKEQLGKDAPTIFDVRELFKKKPNLIQLIKLMR